MLTYPSPPVLSYGLIMVADLGGRIRYVFAVLSCGRTCALQCRMVEAKIRRMSPFANSEWRAKVCRPKVLCRPAPSCQCIYVVHIYNRSMKHITITETPKRTVTYCSACDNRIVTAKHKAADALANHLIQPIHILRCKQLEQQELLEGGR